MPLPWVEISLLDLVEPLETDGMFGFVRTDDEALVSCLGDPQRTVAAYRELLRRGRNALSAIRSGLQDGNPAVREGCKFAHSDARAVAALEASHAKDPSPAVRKKAGWFIPGGTIYERTAHLSPDRGTSNRPL